MWNKYPYKNIGVMILFITAVMLVCSFSRVALAGLSSTVTISTFGAKIENDPDNNRDSDDYMVYLYTSSGWTITLANIFYWVFGTDPSGEDFIPTSVSLKIYKGSDLIKTEELPKAKGEQQTTWFGKDNSNSLVAPGIYTAVIEVEYAGKKAISREHEIKVIKVQILEPSEAPVTANNFAFNLAHPGVCNVTAIGTTGIPSEDSKLEWRLTGISDSTQTSAPSPPKGPDVTFTYTELPYLNSQFGNKTLTLKFPLEPLATDSKTVQIFFSRDGTNHPNGITRNWYYYWKEGNVVSDLAHFEYKNASYYGSYFNGVLYVANLAPTDNETFTVYNEYMVSGPDGICNTKAGDDDFQVIPVGKGKPNSTAIVAGGNGILDSRPAGDDKIFVNIITTGPNGICNTIARGDDIQAIPVGKGQPNSVIIMRGSDGKWSSMPRGNDDIVTQTERLAANGSGIDCTAQTCSHELMHKWVHDNLVKGVSDSDALPDSYELNSPYHFDPTNPDTYGLRNLFSQLGYLINGDGEFLSFKAEQNPGAVYPDKDWSNDNGKNWIK